MAELHNGVTRYAGCDELYGRYLMDPPDHPIFFACIVDPDKDLRSLNLICYGPFETETDAMAYCDNGACKDRELDEAQAMTGRYDPADATMYMKHYRTDGIWVSCDAEKN